MEKIQQTLGKFFWKCISSIEGWDREDGRALVPELRAETEKPVAGTFGSLLSRDRDFGRFGQRVGFEFSQICSPFPAFKPSEWKADLRVSEWTGPC
jgi:hypothetical protein